MCATDLKAGFPTDVAVDISYSFVHSFRRRLHNLQVVVDDSHGGHFFCIQALKQGVPLI